MEKFHKFTRTPHLFDVSEFEKDKGVQSATRDDLLIEKNKRNNFLNVDVTIEEKVDGANLGFSYLDGKLHAQNRSHYINSTSAIQFKPLDKWLFEHYDDILKIVEYGKYILFGEWCVAKHGINYDKLSDYFIAFDIYEIDTKKYLSRKKFYEKLEGTSVKHVPIIYHGKMKKIEDYHKLLATKSKFIDQNIEGIYIRLDEHDTDYLESRCKVVSSEFIEDIEKRGHWSKFEIVKNSIAIDYELDYELDK
jgi:ATP-dependent RNA circularization protein (DNA/RNA ligase family)